jgi:HemY protein
VEETGERARLRALQRLARGNPEHIESRIAIAEAAIACEDWEEARVALAPVAGAAVPAARVCRLMARIEQGEHGNAGKAQAWLARAQDAAPGATWVCTSCRAIRPGWSAVCDHCGAFGAIEWREAPRLSPVAAAAADNARLGVAPENRDAVAIAAGNMTLEAGPEGRPATGRSAPDRRDGVPRPPDIAGPRDGETEDDDVRPPRPD